MLPIRLQPVGSTPRRRSSPGPHASSLGPRAAPGQGHESGLGRSAAGGNHGVILPWASSPSPERRLVLEPITTSPPTCIRRVPDPIGPCRAPPPQVVNPHLKDAEMSVDFLCRKFEVLTNQLRQEEAAREAAERRGTLLAAEAKVAEEALAKARESSLAAVRASASCASQLAAKQAARLQEEAVNFHEQRCMRLAEECRDGSTRCDVALQQLAAEDREAVRSRFESAEVIRRLRQLEADSQVSKEDLRIELHRQLLARNELQSMEQALDAASRAVRLSIQDVEQRQGQLVERQRQISEHDARLQALSESVEDARSETLRRCRRVDSVEEETRTVEAHATLVRQELGVAQRDLQARQLELKAEAEMMAALDGEIVAAETQRAADTREVAAHRQATSEVERAMTASREKSFEACHLKEALCRQIKDLGSEEEQHVAVASAIRRQRHADDLAFEDVQGELQAAFRRKEALAEEISVNTKACDAYALQLRMLRPEISDADERSGRLESALAQRARELEDELQRQRDLMQELAAISEALNEAHFSGMKLEAELESQEGRRQSGAVLGEQGPMWRPSMPEPL
ncbi:unnamed protein product, partial [Polarella glacialis]